MNITKPKLIKPKLFGDLNVWGEKLNETIDIQDIFNRDVVEAFETHEFELKRLDKEKLSIADVPSVVKPVMDNYIETGIKPVVDEYLNTEKKPELDDYTSQKKEELGSYVEEVSKVDINNYTTTKKTEINTLTIENKSQLDSHTTLKEKQLDTYEKTKETELNNYTNTMKDRVTQHTDEEIGRLLSLGVDEILSEIKELTDEIERLEAEKDIITSNEGKKYRLGIDERGILYTQEVQ